MTDPTPARMLHYRSTVVVGAENSTAALNWHYAFRSQSVHEIFLNMFRNRAS